MTQTADIVIIGSGIGGASLAYKLAEAGLRIVILERGDYLRDSPQAGRCRNFPEGILPVF